MNESTRNGLIGMAVLVCVAIIILIFCFPSQDAQCVTLDGGATCFSTNPKPYRHYGTKTSYHVAIENNTDSHLSVGDCTPKVFYLLSRHATRYPDIEYIERIIDSLPILKERIINSSLSGKAKICDADLEKLKKWTNNLKVEDENRLSNIGEAEAEDLGQRFKKRFSAILDQKYSPSKFHFVYTTRSRTKHTAKAFARGLFGETFDINGKMDDDLLTFHKTCKKLQKNCSDPSYDVSESEKFKNGPLMTKLVDSVSQRVGFTLTRDDVEIILTACMFGYALNDSDIWCSLFTTDELKVFEFSKDIDDYYENAYGNEINYKQACPIVKHIVDLFRSTENSSDTQAVLHFSHAGAIKKVYPLFGLFRDETPLKADDFCSLNNRKWRTSLIIPFNSNIAFVLYQCGDEYKVATFHNEKSVKIDGCSGNLCSLNEFYKTYELIAQHCNIKEICCTCPEYCST